MKLTRGIVACGFLVLALPALCFPVGGNLLHFYSSERMSYFQSQGGNNAEIDCPGCPGGNPSCICALIATSIQVELYLETSTSDFGGHYSEALEATRKLIDVARQAYLATGGTDLPRLEVPKKEPGFGLRYAVKALRDIRQNIKQAEKKKGYDALGKYRNELSKALDEEIKQLSKAAEYEK